MDGPVLPADMTKDILHFAKNSVIAAEGEMTRGWYVLLKGRIGVFKKNLPVAEFGERGMIFGELSEILSIPRTATLKSLEDSDVLHLQGGIDGLISGYPEIAKKIIVNLAERLAKTTDDLWLSVSESTKPAAV